MVQLIYTFFVFLDYFLEFLSSSVDQTDVNLQSKFLNQVKINSLNRKTKNIDIINCGAP